MNEWKGFKLADAIDLIGGGTPKTSILEYWNGDIPWLSVNDFNNGRKYVYNTEKKITDLGLQNSSTRLLDKDDIIISARGTVGIIAVLAKEMAFNQSCYGIKAKKGVSTNQFIYYLLKDTIDNFIQISHGGVFDTITRDSFKEIDILLPSLSEQESIAGVLSSLDDKIDLLHRQNQTLEAMAETLFRQWFENEENNSTLSQFISIQNGYAFKSKDFCNDGIHQIIKIKNISNEIIDIISTDYIGNHVTINLQNNYKIQSGDILIAMTGAEIGKLGIIPKTNRSLWLNQRVGMLKEKYLNSKYLAYLHLKSEFGQDYIINTATGSAQPNISGIGIEGCGFPRITENKVIEYSNQVGYFYNKITFNLGQIQTLEKLRDTLLPKLMSGEITIAI